jgi:putative transcriptional regulator
MAHAREPDGHLASGGQWSGGQGKAASALGGAALLVWALCGVGGNLCWGEEKPKSELLFLVARTAIADPFFARSVVLMVPLEGGPVIVGLIVNKPTDLPLLKVFPDTPALKNRSENAYFGGPIDVATPALVFHAQKRPKQAMLLYDDVYLSFDADFIARLLQDPKQTGDVRLFLGRSQWAPEQLQGEALRGSWYSLRAEGDVVFDHDSEHLWKKLLARARPPSKVQDWMSPAPPQLELCAARKAPWF